MTRIDATAAVPIDIASKLTLGARQQAQAAWRQAKREAERLRLWIDRQHLSPDAVMQLAVLLVYGLVTLGEAWLRGRRNSQ